MEIEVTMMVRKINVFKTNNNFSLGKKEMYSGRQIQYAAKQMYMQEVESHKKSFDEGLSKQKQRFFEEMYIELLGIPLLALRNRGYGKKRLKELLDEILVIFDDYHTGVYITSIDDITGVIKEETGFDLKLQAEDFINYVSKKAKENPYNAK